ncbi:MAG: hypothetical protein ACOY90_06290 [Candidatus Zhuqueibacterota bacterium]
MKTQCSYLVGLLSVTLLALAILSSDVYSQEKAKETTIEGMVIGTEWDENDNVISIAISVTVIPGDTTEEEYVIDYLVTENKKGKELTNFVGRDVLATGIVVKDDDGVFIISVREFKVLKEE